jgi:hypothetical protein
VDHYVDAVQRACCLFSYREIGIALALAAVTSHYADRLDGATTQGLDDRASQETGRTGYCNSLHNSPDGNAAEDVTRPRIGGSIYAVVIAALFLTRAGGSA